jgi:beta-N-acetylhexosaminidase
MIDRYDKIVYCSYNARLNEGQAEVIRQIDVKKLIVASLRTPYDLQVLHPDTTYLCAYEATPLSFKSLAKILSGKEKPTGRIPVTI